MRKFFSILCALVMIFSLIAFPCFAASLRISDTVYLEDGSYFVISLTDVTKNRASSTTDGIKTAAYYSDDGVLLWTFVLAASFSYTSGQSAVCTFANSNVEISDSAWSCASKSATPSGASAVGHAEVVKKLLFVTIKTVPVDLTITCDNFGNLT